MPDLTPDILPKIQENRLAELRLSGNFIYPDYGELSIMALPASIASLLDAPPFPSPELSAELLAPVSGDVKRVIWILVDALAFTRLRLWLDQHPDLVWNDLLSAGVLAPITSLAPSTTSTCLPSMWSGLSPAEHGFVGYELWLKEYGVVANMIKHSPFQIDHRPGLLEMAGFDPAVAMPSQNLGSHLSTAGIGVHTFQHISIYRSGLSRLFLKENSSHSFVSTSDLWANLVATVGREDREKNLHWIYWGDVDY
ncbi:MAG: alkaline phosphatase family protein, partial [Anaerolineales bacterium]|nr:alkaline phosphatase family protein [Anaerolineales bacterium]